MPECPLCYQDYGQGCCPASVPCGHVYCDGCLTMCATQAKPCPTCRQPFTLRDIKKLYMDFAEPEPREELPPPPAITEAQRLEARDLFHRLSDDGIETSIDELASVLNEVKLWMNGVEHIQDAETQIALTRLLLGVNILQNKVKNDRTAHQYNRDASQALTALRITIAETQDRLGREIEQTRKLRGYVEDERANVVQLRNAARVARHKIDELKQRDEASRVELSTTYELLDDAEHDRVGLEAELHDTNKEVERLAKLHRRSERQNASLQEAIDQAMSDKEGYKNRVSELEEEVDDLKDQIKSLKSDLRRKSRDVAEYADENESLSAKISESMTLVSSLTRERDHWKQTYFDMQEKFFDMGPDSGPTSSRRASNPGTPNVTSKPHPLSRSAGPSTSGGTSASSIFKQPSGKGTRSDHSNSTPSSSSSSRHRHAPSPIRPLSPASLSQFESLPHSDTRNRNQNQSPSTSNELPPAVASSRVVKPLPTRKRPRAPTTRDVESESGKAVDERSPKRSKKFLSPGMGFVNGGMRRVSTRGSGNAADSPMVLTED